MAILITDPQIHRWYFAVLNAADRTSLEKAINNYAEMPCPVKGIKWQSASEDKYLIHFKLQAGGDYLIDNAEKR